jgi:hypothetical protein
MGDCVCFKDILTFGVETIQKYVYIWTNTFGSTPTGCLVFFAEFISKCLP